MEKILQKAISKAIKSVIEENDVSIEHPADMSHGDFSTNIALVLAKQEKTNPHDLAISISDHITAQNIEYIESVEVAGPGFINFRLTPEYFHNALLDATEKKDEYGKNTLYSDKKIIVEFTDPNPFKEFHIGHLMSNTIGESLSRLFEYGGAEVKRVTYQGDVGMHVAMAVWALQKNNVMPENVATDVLGRMYALGAKAYESDDGAKKEIEDINRKIYEKSDDVITALYEEGKRVSLEAFEEMYERLGTSFDTNFFESQTAPLGKDLVIEWSKKGLFEESEDAYVFKGEDHGLHTRVFINSRGIPTYEAKELALPQLKHEWYPYTDSFVITGNEVNDYFKVLLFVLSTTHPDLASKTTHLGHGMMRLPEGKMSSRTGSVITAGDLLNDIQERVLEKMEEKDTRIADEVAIAAIKYAVLKQGIGKNIIFDFDTAISFEGDSGPYVQYSAVRAFSILQKSSLEPGLEGAEEVGVLERLISRFPSVVEIALKERAPHKITHFITEVASAFNSYYATNQIQDNPYRLLLTHSVYFVLSNGLSILGMKTPSRM